LILNIRLITLLKSLFLQYLFSPRITKLTDILHEFVLKILFFMDFIKINFKQVSRRSRFWHFGWTFLLFLFCSMLSGNIEYKFHVDRGDKIRFYLLSACELERKRLMRSLLFQLAWSKSWIWVHLLCRRTCCSPLALIEHFVTSRLKFSNVLLSSDISILVNFEKKL